MNRLIAVCIFVLISSVVCDSDESKDLGDAIKGEFKENLKEFEEELNKLAKKYCELEGGRTAYRKFVETTDQLEQCLKRTIPDEFELPSEICKVKRPLLRECLERALPGVEGCLSAEEKWLVQDFFIGSINSLYDYSCGNIFNPLKELMSLEGFDCLTNIIRNEDAFDNSTEKCLDKFVEALTSNEDTDLTKPELCKEIDVVEECIVKSIKQQCTTNEGLEHLFQGFVEAIKKPCNVVSTAA